MVENSQGDDAGQQDAYRAHHIDNKGNVEQEKLGDQADGLTFFDKGVNFFEKIDQQVDADKAGHDHPEVTDEVVENIAVEEYHENVVNAEGK